jgi:glucose-1-phosphate adenylyltransferase
MPSKIISLILGGGRGTRLYPLTKQRSKPAVPIAGKYRLIDIPISNCLHSGLNKIFVLTQFNSVSLHRHIANAFKFDPFGQGFVEVLAAQQTLQHETWYQGTADAVRRNIPYFAEADYDHVLILSGDQLYRMDFQDLIRTHREHRADITIAMLPVGEADAPGFGCMKVNAEGRITDFEEKPKTPEALARARSSPESVARLGFSAAEDRPYLASMGIYLFNRDTLVELLASSNTTDFGKELFPQAIPKHRVQAHVFDGYWEDIGTVGAFHRANIELTGPNPPFDFMSGDRPIFTRPRYLPCSRLTDATVKDSLISDGCVIGKGSTIENSVIGVRAQIAEGCSIRNSYLMGADSFETSKALDASRRTGQPPVGIGAGTRIENAIIDKNARIGRNVTITNKDRHDNLDEEPHYVIRDGIVVIPKFTIIPDGTVI